MSYGYAWKTIDTLSAEVPSDEGDRSAEFIVKFGRHAARRRGGPRLGSPDTDDVSFIIENVALGLKVQDSTLQGAKAKLRALLVKKENFSGTWTLWMHVEASGSYAKSGSYNKSETGHATIDTSFHLELVTKTPTGERVRHCTLDEELPTPFTGEFSIPKTSKELERLREGPAFERMVKNWVDDPEGESNNRWRNRKEVIEEQPQVWVEATVENVETVRALQMRLGEMGEKVEQALAKKNFTATLEAVRKGSLTMLGPGAAR